MQFGHFDNLSAAQAGGLDKWAKAVTVSQAEYLRLSSRRAKAYMALPNTVAKCRSPHDLVSQQQAFWNQCAQDYATAAQAMASSWTQFFPFADSITGLEDTINDESLNSAPDSAPKRDVMAVQNDQRSSTAKQNESARRDQSGSANGEKQVAA